MKLNWTEHEREENRRMTEMLLDNAATEQKEQGRTTEEFIHSIMMALRSLVDDDMVTEDEAIRLARKYILIYDPNWQAPIREGE